MAGVNINAYVTYIAPRFKPSDSPTIRRDTITSLLGIYINHEAQQRCHGAFFVIRPRLVKRPRNRPGPGYNTPARACPTAGSRRTLHVHYMRCAAPRSVVPCSRRTNKFMLSNGHPLGDRCRRGPHAYTVTCLREGGGSPHRQRRHERGRDKPCDTRICAVVRPNDLCLSVCRMDGNFSGLLETWNEEVIYACSKVQECICSLAVS